MASNLKFPSFGHTSNGPSREFSLIRECLEDTDSSAESTAKELTILADNSSSPELNESECSLEGFLWSLWAIMVQMVEQVPQNHPWQDRMVNILGAIKEIPPRVTPEMVQLEQSWGMACWQDLPIFGAEIRETWNDGPWEKRLRPAGNFYHPFHADVWANLNAFTARLTAASVMNFDIYAIWILRHTLEEERRDDEVDDNLPAATMWIIHAGRIIYHNAAKVYTDQAGTYPPNVRYLRKFSTTFSRERWNFWKERFGDFQGHEGLKQSTRDSAEEALRKMAEIERRDPEPMVSKRSSLPVSGVMRAVQAQSMSGDQSLS